MSSLIDENRPPNVAAMGKKGKTIEEIYTKKTQLEHILLRPDTYVGSIEKQQMLMWVYDSETKKIVQRNTTFVPGLYKIFDEILVNAADNKQRDPKMTKIEVTIDAANNSIRVGNNGNGIPIVMHQEHNVYVPELIFGHLLTGSNFDDQEQKTTGGRNGYGAKLANIFSSEFVVETIDSSRGLSFKQNYSNNMSTRGEPVIKKVTSTDYTSITFKPDLKRFKMDCLDEDTVALLCKRVYDIAGTNSSGSSKISVYLNGERIDVKSLEGYINLFSGLEMPCAFQKVSDRWEIGVGPSEGSFQQVSYCNSICTIKGGQHVNYIADQVITRLAAVLKKRNKGVEIKPNQIKNHLAVYVNALIVNPAFDSQTKENLTTKPVSFGSTCVVPEKMLKELEKSNIVDKILDWARYKQNAELKKKGGSKQTRVMGITKLDDANFAGTSKSLDCTLILTEGDSAKALAISGLSVVGRDYYGVFPLKGKLLNVREASHAQIMKNEEIQNIAKILGLTFGKVYENCSSLRYGHLMIMTDQDHDGSHIKGLLINFLHHFWPSLLLVPGFLQQFITPIVKCTKGKSEETFFTIPQYLTWKESKDDGKGWKIKYYKGLGTSTSAEAKEYFSHLETHEINFSWDQRSGDQIDMAFSKKRVDDRKTWLLAMEPGVFIDYSVPAITYDDFVNHELILFSHADNERSIPHFMDGFKPSHRKVLFCCCKRNLKQEIKVAQLAGYVSEHSAYHHGEASLTQTIIGMAQNYIGSNNVNLLSPCGQFGTRLMGGKDAASPRYVFTKLEAITRCIFHPHDDPLLNYLDDDGQSIEPSYYVPIIPMILVNGSEGIGTGWSTSVPTYNPRDIIANLRKMITGELAEHMVPWFRGFTGDIAAKAGGNYTVSGTIEQIDDSTVVISELPVGKWTTDYKQFLESMIVGNTQAVKEDGAAPQQQFIKGFKENHTDTSVLFTVQLAPEKLVEILGEKGGLQKRFKLDTSIALSNMHLFDLDSHIRKFDTVKEIMDAFFDVRLGFYDKRKEYLIKKLTEEWERLDNKCRFILAVVQGKLVVANRKKTELLEELKAKGFKMIFPAKQSHEVGAVSSDSASEDDVAGVSHESLDKGYDYLLSMKIWSLTLEKVQALTKEKDEKHHELELLMEKSPENLWVADLDELETALDDFDRAIEETSAQEKVAQRRANIRGKNARKPAKGKGGAWNSDDDGDDFDDDDFDDKPKKKTVVRKPAAATASKPVVEMKAVPSKPLSSKAVPSKSAPAPKPVVSRAAPAAVKSKLKKKSFDSDESDEEDEDDFSDDDDDDNSDGMDEGASKVVVAKKPTAVRSAAQAASKKVIELLSDSEEDDDLVDSDSDASFNSEEPKKIAAPKKVVAAASKPSTKVHAPKIAKAASSKVAKKASALSDEEDDLVDSDSDVSFNSDKPKKKAAPKKSAPQKPASQKQAVLQPVVSKAKASAVITIDDDDSDRPSKPAASSKSTGDLFSRLQDRVKASQSAPAKPTSVFDYPSESSQDEGLKPAAKPIAKPKSVATLKPVKESTVGPSKGVKRVKKVVGSPSSVDENAASKKKQRKDAGGAGESKKAAIRVDDSDDGAPTRARSPKPSRARKPVNFASFYDSEGEDDASDDLEEEDSDFE